MIHNLLRGARLRQRPGSSPEALQLSRIVQIVHHQSGHLVGVSFGYMEGRAALVQTKCVVGLMVFCHIGRRNQ